MLGYDGLDRLVDAKVGLNNDTCSGAVGDGEYPDETYTYDPNTGNLASKTGLGNYTYGSSDHAHAVTATGNGNSYGYDANGNQITRVIGSITYTLSYDAENRLVSVSWAIGSTNHSMTFVFDGDGSRVKSALDGTTTTFAGTHYEVTGSAVVTKYYYSGTSRIAMRSSIGVRYIFGDHLGSASVTAESNGSSVTRQLYKPYGETRSSGSVPTKYTFTGQYSYSTEIGLVYYVARFYDPSLGCFAQADSIIPEESQGVQAWNRYAYVNNSPTNFHDPTGHNCEDLPNGPREECVNNRESQEELRENEESINELSTTEKIGKVLTVAFVEIFIMAPVDFILIDLTLAVPSAGYGAGTILEAILIPADIVAADFTISLVLDAKRDIESGHDLEFQWTFLPSIISEFPKPVQENAHDLLPGIFPQDFEEK